ncbi:SWIM zinc finger family protein [Metabacillus iocasae]|uniref:SWIM-type domain-containing protein n=1 Tax=Priestia iocasae TaxID=2291674 RepID=A0ABS2QVU0_9BACI|nr:SWIM zinc finger family protein [Metabacillus iocasae]MBM7703590.1 hypothetical protein [Metabacillus iocasae]
MTLTELYIDSIAPNASAVKNGWGLVKKKKFEKLHQSNDQTLLFGECAGSGKKPYVTSVDFINPEQPTYRCTCPSRQFPCKHALGLLYAYVDGQVFTEAPIPEDVIEKREKIAKRVEKKQAESVQPKKKKVNKSALRKKLQAQLEGLVVVETLLHNLVRGGLGSVDVKALKQIEATAKEVGNYYLKELQHALREFVQLWKEKLPEEELYVRAIHEIQRLSFICKKGKSHLQTRLQDEELALDTTTSIEEWLGHTWQLAELRELGMVKRDEELVQLFYTSYQNDARKEYMDEGIWLSLQDHHLYYTKQYRPFRAAKQLKQEDSTFSVIHTDELIVYPSEGNARVRWETSRFEELLAETFLRIHQAAQTTILDVLKQVKNQLKQPLADKQPLALIAYDKIGKVNEKWLLQDKHGQRLTLVDAEGDTLPLLSLVRTDQLSNHVLLVKFQHNLQTGELGAKPLSLITHDQIIRFK